MLVVKDGHIVEKRVKEICVGDLLIQARKVNFFGESRNLREVDAKRYYRLTQKGLRLIRDRVKSAGRKKVLEESGLTRSYLDHILRCDRHVREDRLRTLLQTLNLRLNSELCAPVDSTHGKFLYLPDRTSPALLQWIGYLIGDGHVGKRSIRFKDADQETLRVYQRLTESLFGIEGRIVKLAEADAFLLEVNSRFLCDWLNMNFLRRLDAFISDVGQLSRDEVRAFLKGLFDAEAVANTYSRQILFRICNERLARTVQFLLLRFGVCSSFSSGRARQRSWSQVFSVSVSTYEDIQAFNENIGFSSPQKQGMVNLILCKMCPGLSYIQFPLPFEKEALRKQLKGQVGSFLKGEGYITRRTLEEILHVLKSAPLSEWASNTIAALRRYLDADIVFERVLEVKCEPSDVEFVYDLEVARTSNFIANCLISHNSRWATHGAPSQENAHPHTDCIGKIAVAHNGIIENFLKLRSELERKGHVFRSRTDTEVIPHLIEEYVAKGSDLVKAVMRAAQKLRGAFAIVVVSTYEPDKIVCARRESPLVIGVGSKSYYCASDIPAFLPLTNRAMFVEEDELAVLTQGGVEIFDLRTGELKKREITTITWTPEIAERGGYPHFMLKEIYEQPLTLRNVLRTQELYYDLMTSALDRARRVFLVACGTSYHACVAASYMFSQLANLEVQPIIASEFIEQYGGVVDKDSVILAVSQSGETADTLAAVRFAKQKGATILGITNVMGSTLTRLSSLYIGQNSGPEKGVAATKTFTAQLMVLAKLAVNLAKKRGSLPVVKAKFLERKLGEIPEILKQILCKDQEGKIRNLAKKYRDKPSFCFLGRGINTATAVEGKLKLLEIAYLPCIAYPAGESKHGFIAVVDKGYPVIFAAPRNQTHPKIIGNIMEMKARGAEIIALIEKDDEEIKKLADEFIELPPGIPEILTPIPYVVPLQLFAYYMAVELGCNPDMPRNLAKSVTVE